jgi:hypothetical protein
MRSRALLITIRCKFDQFPASSQFRDTWALKNYTLGGGPVLTGLLVARAHQPTLWVDLRVDSLHQPTLTVRGQVYAAPGSRCMMHDT